MQRRKVLHVLTTTAGGLGQSVLAILRALDPERYEVSVAFGPGYPLDRAFEESGFQVHRVRLRRGLSPANLLGALDLYRLLRRERYDIVHVHSPQAGVIARILARLRRVPVVVFTIHGYTSVSEWDPIQGPLLWLADKALDPFTDFYVAVSRWVEDSWVRRRIVARNRITTIHHAMEAPPELAPEERARRRAELGIGPDVLLVGTAGLLEPRKATDVLLDAAPRVLAAVPSCVFWILGEGPRRAALEEQAGRLELGDHVRFLGWRDDAVDLIALLDVFCLPSLREAFGLVLMEAMAHDRPVVASRVQAIPEVVSEGETALLVPPQDPAALADAIVTLLKAPERAKEMGLRGGARMRTEFAPARMRAQYTELYERLATAADRRPE